MRLVYVILAAVMLLVAAHSPEVVGYGPHAFACRCAAWGVVVYSVMVAAWAARGGAEGAKRRRCRLVVRGLCGGCGYDLRASDRRCPECGRERAATPDRVAALGRIVP